MGYLEHGAKTASETKDTLDENDTDALNGGGCRCSIMRCDDRILYGTTV